MAPLRSMWRGLASPRHLDQYGCPASKNRTTLQFCQARDMLADVQPEASILLESLHADGFAHLD